MESVVRVLRDPRLFGVWVAFIAATVFLPGLGSYGLWEPNEIKVASRATEIPSEREKAQEAIPKIFTALGAWNLKELSAAAKELPSSKPQTRSTFHVKLIASAIARGSRSEYSGRLPVAGLAILLVLATFFLGLRVGGPRVGLVAAIIACTFPAVLMHARHLTSDIATATGQALLGLGLFGLLTGRGFGFVRSPKPGIVHLIVRLIDICTIAAGAVLAYLAGGVLLGLLPPLLGVGLAALLSWREGSEVGVGDNQNSDQNDGPASTAPVVHTYYPRGQTKRFGRAVAVISLGASIAVFSLFLYRTFDLVDPQQEADERFAEALERAESAAAKRAAAGKPASTTPPATNLGWKQFWQCIAEPGSKKRCAITHVEPGYWFLGGRDVRSKPHYVPALAGVWRAKGDLKVSFASTLDSIAFGAFPWIAIVPMALIMLLVGPGSPRVSRSAIALWVMAAFVLGAVFARKVGVATFPAWSALAVAASLWLCDVFGRRSAQITGDTTSSSMLNPQTIVRLVPVLVIAIIAIAIAVLRPSWFALVAIALPWFAGAFAPSPGLATTPVRANRRLGSQLVAALPLAGFFALAVAVVVGKDIIAFPEKLLELNLVGAKQAFPDGVALHKVFVGVGILAMLITAVAVSRLKVSSSTASEDLDEDLDEPSAVGDLAHWLRARRAPAKLMNFTSRGFAAVHQRVGKPVSSALRAVPSHQWLALSLALTIGGATLFAQSLTPALSEKLSAKNILGAYRQLRVASDTLGIMGNAEGASFYANGEFEQLTGRKSLVEFLARPNRVFALAPVGERCPLNKEVRRKEQNYYVLDDSNARFHLYSNQLKDGERDLNELATTFSREKPSDIRKELSFDFEDRMDLIGISMPDSVRKGSTFKVKLYFKIKKAMSRNWKVFAHFDSRLRFQGDHDPSKTFCGTTFWLPGDYVTDEFEVVAGSRTHPSGPYKLLVGLFVGSGENWTRMKVDAPGVVENRVPVGTITLK